MTDQELPGMMHFCTSYPDPCPWGKPQLQHLDSPDDHDYTYVACPPGKYASSIALDGGGRATRLDAVAHARCLYGDETELTVWKVRAVATAEETHSTIYHEQETT